MKFSFSCRKSLSVVTFCNYWTCPNFTDDIYKERDYHYGIFTFMYPFSKYANVNSFRLFYAKNIENLMSVCQVKHCSRVGDSSL